MKKESVFKRELYKEIRERFPGAEVSINDAGYIQGFPDATVYLPNGRYILIEGKRSAISSCRPNQDHYVNNSSLKDNALFVFPENKEEVLKEIERRFKMDEI